MKLSFYLFLFLALSPAASPDPETGFTLEDVAFMTGHWQHEGEAYYFEEIWSAARGDNMMGMFRFVQAGEGVFYEMMIIEAVESDVVLRLKHFNAGLIGWEEKEEVHSFYLTKKLDTEVVFEVEDKNKRLRYVFQSPDELTVHLEELKEGEWTQETFAFKRLA